MTNKVHFFNTPTPDKFGEIFEHKKEFLASNGEHCSPGWYFWDIDSEEFGPFISEEHAKNALHIYITKLMAGSITPAPRRLLKPGPGQTWS